MFHKSPVLEKYFNKILVANRGEIACRVMRTAKRLGIKTVAVYSDADINSKFVHMADEAVRIGPAPVNQSYLIEDNIIDAMRKTGAEAVHPGYGFLSENAHFSDRVTNEGFVFIGPPGKAISLMGDKIESKKIAADAGVNTIPGFKGEVKDTDHAVKIAEEIGYPVMLKASAGGGGKGIRICRNEQQLRESYEISSAEALNFFGSSKMLVERFVEQPRHVEIQVICDTQGNYIYLPERECSIQRRNQKVIEEAPCSVMDPETRRKMGEQAVSLARNVGYVSAGTVEMLLDPQKNFYFLEMNTRLQVEHPVTEYITGVDLVEEMFRAAAGLPLSFKQEDVEIKGWATECRVYAEDPAKNYAPSIGGLDLYIEPFQDDPSVRVDSGINQGSEISMFYDPMISKLITYGENREQSIDKMIASLDKYIIRGVKHNITLLRTVLSNQRYRDGNLATSFLKEEYGDEFQQLELTDKQLEKMVSCAAIMELCYRNRDQSIDQKDNPQHYKPITEAELTVSFGEQTRTVYAKILKDGEYSVKVNGKEFIVKTPWKVGNVVMESTMNGEEEAIQLLKKNADEMLVQYLGNQYEVSVCSPKEKKYKDMMPYYPPPDASKFLIASMPGTVVSVAVKEGDKIRENAELCIVEAMKMQNVLRCLKDCVVTKVHIKPGDVIDNDDLLIEMSPLQEEGEEGEKKE